MANLFFHICKFYLLCSGHIMYNFLAGIILAYSVFCIMSYGDVSYLNIAIATSLSRVTWYVHFISATSI